MMHRSAVAQRPAAFGSAGFDLKVSELQDCSEAWWGPKDTRCMEL